MFSLFSFQVHFFFSSTISLIYDKLSKRTFSEHENEFIKSSKLSFSCHDDDKQETYKVKKKSTFSTKVTIQDFCAFQYPLQCFQCSSKIIIFSSNTKVTVTFLIFKILLASIQRLSKISTMTLQSKFINTFVKLSFEYEC